MSDDKSLILNIWDSIRSDISQPVDVSLSDLLSRKEYLDDFVESQKESEKNMKKNTLMMKLEGCAELQAHLLECAQNHPFSDPKYICSSC